MKAKCLAGALLLVAFATPALADSYYVVQELRYQEMYRRHAETNDHDQHGCGR